MARLSGRQDAEEFLDESSSLWRIALAPIVWAFHFLFCYGGAAVWCAKYGAVEGVTFLRLSILVLTVVALALIGWLGWRARIQWNPQDEDTEAPEERHQFLGHAALLLAIISAVGVVYVALPALFIGTCQ